MTVRIADRAAGKLQGAADATQGVRTKPGPVTGTTGSATARPPRTPAGRRASHRGTSSSVTTSPSLRRESTPA